MQIILLLLKTMLFTSVLIDCKYSMAVHIRQSISQSKKEEEANKNMDTFHLLFAPLSLLFYKLMLRSVIWSLRKSLLGARLNVAAQKPLG